MILVKKNSYADLSKTSTKKDPLSLQNGGDNTENGNKERRESSLITPQRLETTGSWYNHVYRLNQVIQNMTRRGLPIDKEALDKLGVTLDKEKERLAQEVRKLLSEREESLGRKFWQYDEEEDGYKGLPKILREECKARGMEVEEEVGTFRPITQEEIDKLVKEWEEKCARAEAKGKKPPSLKLPKKVKTTTKKMILYPEPYCEEEYKYPCPIDKYKDWFIEYAIEAGFEFMVQQVPLDPDTQDVEESSVLVKREEFNPGSAAQLKEYCLFMSYSIPVAMKKTSQGKEEKETTDDKALEDLLKTTKDPMFRFIQDFREVSKLRSTYVEGWQPNGKDGRLHSTFTFTPATGQLSSRNPNVQNAPSHSGDFGNEFKKVVRAREGRVIVNCVAPGTKVLMRDLTWKNAEDILPGESLLGFDEFPTAPTSRRYFKTSTVEQTSIQNSPRLYISTDMGDIIVSPDHKFIKRISGRGQWLEATKLKKGDRVLFFTQPWEVANNYDGGWLAGFLDGEGYLGNGGGNKWAGFRATGLGFGQNDGAAAEKAQQLFADLGFVLTKQGNRTCKQYHVSSRASNIPYAWLRAIGQLRPVRLLSKAIDATEGLATWGTASKPATILNIYKYKSGPVVAIKTTSKTLITNGFLSHNCDYAGYHALMTGYFAGSKKFMRLSVMGAHDYLAAYMLRRQIERMKPTELATDLWQETISHISDLDSWLDYDDATLRAKLKWIKKNHDHLRNKKAKPTVHGVNFGLGAKKMYEMNKDSFSSIKEAQEIKDLFFMLFPEIKMYQEMIVAEADKSGPQGKRLVTPYGFVRRFWEAQVWHPGKREMVNGEDAEKAIAFLPACTAFSIKKEAMLRLEEIGANEEYCFFNEVHDSMNYEPREQDLDEALKVIYREMTRPVMRLQHPILAPEGLICDVEVSYGPSWKEQTTVEIKL